MVRRGKVCSVSFALGLARTVAILRTGTLLVEAAGYRGVRDTLIICSVSNAVCTGSAFRVCSVANHYCDGRGNELPRNVCVMHATGTTTGIIMGWVSWD